MSTNPILVLMLDDEPTLRQLLEEDLPEHGIQVISCDTCAKARTLLKEKPFQAILLDYHLPDGTGEDFYRSIRSEFSNIPVIFITSHPDIEKAVGLLKEGAADYVLKPFSIVEIASRIKRVVEVDQLRAEVDYHRRKQHPSGNLVQLLGNSAAVQTAQRAIEEIAKSPLTPVLITGETGTGKEVVARLIHQKTHGENQPFVEVDCTTLPRDLFESELFGHERGSFTGADRSKEGLFELGKEGSVFLDEIGDIYVDLQSRLLRVLETRQFRRVGGTKPIAFGSRVIAATNRDLQDMMKHGQFRSDLYFRLAVYQIHLPPLRERPEDIKDLANYFFKEAVQRHNKKSERLSDGFFKKLEGYPFPGNIRELRNLVEQAVIQSAAPEADLGSKIQLLGSVVASSAPQSTSEKPASAETKSAEAKTLFEREKEAVLAAIQESKGNKSAAARILGISRAALLRRMSKLEITTTGDS